MIKHVLNQNPVYRPGKPGSKTDIKRVLGPWYSDLYDLELFLYTHVCPSTPSLTVPYKPFKVFYLCCKPSFWLA